MNQKLHIMTKYQKPFNVLCPDKLTFWFKCTNLGEGISRLIVYWKPILHFQNSLRQPSETLLRIISNKKKSLKIVLKKFGYPEHDLRKLGQLIITILLIDALFWFTNSKFVTSLSFFSSIH